jgi:hypothetical protein
MLKRIFLILAIYCGLLLGSRVRAVGAWNDCPLGKVNDPYPGSCANYIDTDGDGLCDHSQPPPEERTDSQQTTDYHAIFISVALLLSYGTSFYLSKVGKVSLVAHRKVWNVFLALSFFGAALTGTLLALRVIYHLDVNLPFNLLFWHLETGMVMTIVALFHIAWHLSYFKNVFR